MKKGKHDWRIALDRAIKDGLVSKLNNQSPKPLMKDNIVSWDDVAPKTGKNLSLTIGNSGVCVSGSRTNSCGLYQIYKNCYSAVNLRKDICLTPIREWATGHKNFCMKPSMAVKRMGEVHRIDALYHCFKLTVEVLESYA